MSIHSRRLFLSLLATAAAGAAVGAPAKPKKPARLRILILDGTGPLAPHQARYALERGHAVTVHARGDRDPELPAKTEFISGIRQGDYAELAGKTYDVVIDNGAARLARIVVRVAPHIASAKQYIFLADEVSDAEETVHEYFPGTHTIVRTGTIAGPGDRTDRFTYWAVRVAGRGEVLAPGDPDAPAGLIDVRDLAEFMIRLAEQRVYGTFDAVSPLTMKQLLEGVREATGSSATLTWVSPQFLEANQVKLPVWTRRRFDSSSAVKHGLTFRPVTDTVESTLTWHVSRDSRRQMALRVGLTPEVEARLLEQWKKENAQ
jgi:2'-hydroxyisoflavone reductase